jgi:predicted alpha/beta hydrolase family esterase
MRQAPLTAGPPILIVPGIGGSGPEHWQTRWEKLTPGLHAGCQRVQQDDWERPDYAAWSQRLENAVAACRQPPLLVAHSLGCLLTVRWAASTAQTVHGALLVAPPDPSGPEFPAIAHDFSCLPGQELPFPSILVASRDDHYGDLIFAASCAARWGSRFVDAGFAGHLNADSRLGDWPAGLALLEQLAGSPRH